MIITNYNLFLETRKFKWNTENKINMYDIFLYSTHDIPKEFLEEMESWENIYISPSKKSFYNKPVNWNYKEVGTVRISDHWNFLSKGKEHCKTNIPVKNNTHYTLAIFNSNGIFEIIKSIPKDRNSFNEFKKKYKYFPDEKDLEIARKYKELIEKEKLFLKIKDVEYPIIKYNPKTTIYIKNNNKIKIDTLDIEKNIIIKESKENDDLIKSMFSDPMVQVKELGDGIVSLNFSRAAFIDKVWNERTIKARGLFFDKNRQKIVARGFQKFFNTGELEPFETSIEKMVYPINVWHKYNGFLGILSINPNTNDFFICSKSTDKGEFSNFFKNILLKNKEVEYLKDYLSNNDVSIVFEVIDIENDPHIIEYDKSHLVILDIIYNDLDFKTKPYQELKNLGKKLDIKVKELVKTINSKKELNEFYEEILDKDYKLDGKYLEGFVFEDKNGFMIKFKTHFYNYWKRVRGLVDRLKRIKTISNLDDNILKLGIPELLDLERKSIDEINKIKKDTKGNLSKEDRNLITKHRKLKEYLDKINALFDSNKSDDLFNFLVKKNVEELDKPIIELRNEFLKK